MCEIRGVAENRALLGHYAASTGNFLPTFRDILSFPSSRFSCRRFGSSFPSPLQGFLADVSGHSFGPIFKVFLPTFWVFLSVPSSRFSCRRFGSSFRSHLQGFLTDVSGHSFGPIFKVFLPMFRDILSVPFSRISNGRYGTFYGSNLQGRFLTPDNGTDMLARNVLNKLPLLAA